MTPNATDAATPVAGMRVAIIGAIAWLATFIVLLGVVTLFSLPRPGQADAPAIERAGRELAPNTANARPSGTSIVVANRSEAALTLLAVGTAPFRAADYGLATVRADAVPRGVELALVWVRTDDPARPHEHAMEVTQGRVSPTTLDDDPEWRGDIRFLAVAVKGASDRPLEIRGFALEPLDFGAALGDAFRGWSRLERWDGRSINVLFGGRESQRTWLPPIAFAASLVSALAAWLQARRRRERLPFGALALPFLAGWLLVDLRWQANLFAQARDTLAEFAGRSYEQRHLAMEDGDLFRFAQAALVQLPKEPARIFATSDFEYFRRRAGYHLYPHNVLAYDWAEPSVIRPGDYVFFYQKNDVRFDARAGELQWTNGRTLKAQPVVARRGAGLFLAKEPAP